MVELSREAFEEAKARGEARLRGPRARSAHYDAERGLVVITLLSGEEICVAPGDIKGLEAAGREDLETLELEPFGLGIRFPRLDADLYVPTLVGQAGAARPADEAQAEGPLELGARPSKPVGS